MITCRELIDCLVDYVSDELPREQKDHIDRHLQSCPPCVTYIETYRLTIRLTRELPPKPVPPELKNRLRQALESYSRDERQPPATG